MDAMVDADIRMCLRQLPLPGLLLTMLEDGRWKHPGDEVMVVKVPFIGDPLLFLSSIESMLFNSGPLMARNAAEDSRFSEYLGSQVSFRDLPWIDVEKTVFIIMNEPIGDDAGIALDYRIGIDTPRVIGSD
jgi:hypothetical protein